MGTEVITIGMDLGASKTSVVASNGTRGVLPSIIGWPKDQIARGCLGKDVLYGQDVVKNRLALRVVRPFEKGMLKYIDPSTTDCSDDRIAEYKLAAQLLIREAVSLAKPGDASLHGVIGIPSRASVASQRLLLEAAETVFDQVLVIPEPFAVAFGMDRLQNTLVIDIGASTIDICPMFGTFPEVDDQQTVPMAGDSIDEEFYRRMGDMYPEAQLSINMARDIKERYGSVGVSEEKAIITLPTDEGHVEFDVTGPLRGACETIVNPLLDGVRCVLARLDPEFRPAMLSDILLSGGGSQLRGLDRAIEAGLRQYPTVRVNRVFDSLFAGAMGAYKLGTAMSHDEWEVLYRVESIEEQQDPSSEAVTTVSIENAEPAEIG